jgi:hypothetical protein
MSINKVTLPDGTTHNLVPGAGDIVVKSKLYFEAVNEDNVTYKKLVAEYVAPDPEDIDTAGTLTVYDLNGNTMFTMDMNNHRFDFLSVVNMLTAGTLKTTDVVKPSGSTWDGTNTSLATAISSLNSTLSNLSKLLVGILNNDGSITLSPKGGSHLLIISRANNSVYCGLVFDYWGTDIKVAFGTLPSNLMVGKNASSNNVSITNHLGFAVAYTLV